MKFSHLSQWWGLGSFKFDFTHAPWAVTLFAPCLLVFTGANAGSACPPEGFTRDRLLELKAKDFAMPDRERNELADSLLPCLADTDPQLRDGVAFEALATWMRDKRISTSTAKSVMQSLLPWLEPNYPDPAGVARPFAALALAEVARMDRIEAFLSAAELDRLVKSGIAFEASVNDYRGFDAKVGWRHGVAHGADLLLQLALNKRLGKQELNDILAAIAVQVAPQGEHFYTYGEGERLARVVYYIGQRNLHSQQEWREWLSARASPAPWAKWSDVVTSQSGLAKRHNTAAFVTVLYASVQEGGDAGLKSRLLEPLVEALKVLP